MRPVPSTPRPRDNRQQKVKIEEKLIVIILRFIEITKSLAAFFYTKNILPKIKNTHCRASVPIVQLQ